MNKVVLMGRLTKDVDTRYSQGTESKVVARFNIAVDRKYKNDEQTADFINCVAFGKTGEFIDKYFHKGMKIVVCGRIQTGSYTDKDGKKVFTTDVVVEEAEFAEKKDAQSDTAAESKDGFVNLPEGLEDDLPFSRP